MLPALFHEEYRENALKFSAKIYGLFSLICLASYFANFHPLYFILVCGMSMFPQIYTNYMVGHKLKNTMKHFLLYALPKYFLIVIVI